MSVWWSQSGRNDIESSGSPIVNITNVHFDATTDIDGMFEIDLSSLPFSVNRVLSHSGFVLGQTLSAVTDVAEILSVMIVEVSETIIRGVVVLGSTAIMSIGQTVGSLKRAGQGHEVKLIVAVQRG